MPGTLSKDDTLKRKRRESRDDVKKRARTESSDDDEDVQSQILLLETEILESKKNYNNIVELINFAKDVESDTESAILAAVVDNIASVNSIPRIIT